MTPMTPPPHDLIHGWNGLLLAYAVVLLAMLAGLAHGRAGFLGYMRGLLLSIPVLLVAAMAIALVDRLIGLRTENALQLCVGIAVSVAIAYGSGRLIAARKARSDSRHRRGAVVTSAAASLSAQPGQSSDPDTPLTIAGHCVTLQDEVKHFKFVGTTGTGKSTAIRELLNTALARGDRAIIADPDGGYLDTFYDAARADVILNPFSPGAAQWNLFSEIQNDYDVDQLARSLIPDSGAPDQDWIGYARTLIAVIIQQLTNAGVKDDAEIYRLLNSASEKELQKLLADTAAGPFVATGKMFHCVRSIAASSLSTLKYTTRQEGAPFSVREWVAQGAARRNGGRGGVLFMPYQAGQIAALRSIISAWMRIAIFAAMSQPEGDQRLWFIVDELDALGEIDGLKDALARLRKFGGRCVLGFQSIAQVSNTYKGSAHTIVENCGNTLLLRCSASEHGGTSEFASKLIGQREVVHTTQSRSRPPGRWLWSTTHSETIKIEPAIMASEIERLPDLEGFLKMASLPDWRRVTLRRPAESLSGRGKRPSEPTSDSPSRSRTTVSAPGSSLVAPPTPPVTPSPLADRGAKSPAPARARQPRARANKTIAAAARNDSRQTPS